MKKTNMFSLLILAVFLLVAPNAGLAGVIYQDIADVTTHNSEYWDLDNNGSSDVGITWDYEEWDDSNTASAAKPFGAPDGNGFAASGVLSLKMAAGDVIGGSLDFKGDTTMLSRYYDDQDWEYYKWGKWDNMADGDTAYLGFRFQGADDGDHYGWIQARVNPESQYITIYDLAWESEAGKAIAAGDMGSPVPVPAAVWLLGSGLAGLMGIRKKTVA
ncbi:MAG: VPLPA-CTERM sorting domain-containing protein [Desulfobacteraceae bacterium]|nr:VPLPA-CTERM sorting domain-containing protein [Desulfobacteraceae bacterium]